MIIVRNKYLDIQVALRDVNIVPTHFVLIPEAGSHDNTTKAVFERGDSPASAFWELGSQVWHHAELPARILYIQVPITSSVITV